MAISFFALDGGIAITCGEGVRHRRKVVSYIELTPFNLLAQRLNLSDRRKVGLALRLSHIRSVYGIGAALENVSSDSAVARWIGDIDKSIKRVADAPRNDVGKFEEARNAMISVANEWAKLQPGVELSNQGFEVSRVGGSIDVIDWGTYHFISRWFQDASLILQFAKAAKKRLEELDRSKRGFGVSHSKESMLYGHDLPRLYERMSGKQFGITKTRDGARTRLTTGVAFVLDAANSIGLPKRTPDNVASHWKAVSKRKKAAG